MIIKISKEYMAVRIFTCRMYGSCAAGYMVRVVQKACWSALEAIYEVRGTSWSAPAAGVAE